MTVKLVATQSGVFNTCAARSAGALTADRLMKILKGKPPVGNERFCFMAVLGRSTHDERVQMALESNLAWSKFAQRFQDLTGIHRSRVDSDTSLLEAPESDFSETDLRLIA